MSRRIRHLFVPALGQVLIKSDYSQVQMRIPARLSQDPELIKIFNEPNGDVHAATSDWLGLNDLSVAKEINFSVCFWMGPVALCRKINELKELRGCTDFIDEQTARSYIEGFYRRFPKVKDFFDQAWHKKKKRPAQERAVSSLLERERRFPLRPSTAMERRFRVTWPQQIEADLVKTSMVTLDIILWQKGMGARIFMMIHDTLWVEAPRSEAIQTKRLVRRIMATAVNLNISLVADVS